jgi:hypothetical protein
MIMPHSSSVGATSLRMKFLSRFHGLLNKETKFFRFGKPRFRHRST